MIYAQSKLMLSKARNSCNMKPEFWIRNWGNNSGDIFLIPMFVGAPLVGAQL